eukprot:3561655-Rhodomonas_salina.1
MELVWKQAIREAGGVGSILKEVDVPASFEKALQATCGKTIEKSVDKHFKLLGDGVIQKSVQNNLEQLFQGKIFEESMEKFLHKILQRILENKHIDLTKSKKKPVLKKKKKTGSTAPPGSGSYLQNLFQTGV